MLEHLLSMHKTLDSIPTLQTKETNMPESSLYVAGGIYTSETGQNCKYETKWNKSWLSFDFIDLNTLPFSLRTERLHGIIVLNTKNIYINYNFIYYGDGD